MRGGVHTPPFLGEVKPEGMTSKEKKVKEGWAGVVAVAVILVLCVFAFSLVLRHTSEDQAHNSQVSIAIDMLHRNGR